MAPKNILLISVGLIIFAVAIFAVSSYFSSEAVSSNRNGLTQDLYNFGTIAQLFYRRPVSMKGGGNSFTG